MSIPAPIGANVSTAGGAHLAFGRGLEIGCESIQIFVKSPSQWQARMRTPDEVAAFREAHSTSGMRGLVAHASYLINLATTDPGVLEASRRALGDELDRCHDLGVPELVLHPGAHLGRGIDRGIEAVARSLDVVLGARTGCGTRLLLEIMAGQGTLLGYELEQLARIREATSSSRRIGICIDTCHAFAAGYPVDREDGYAAFLDSVEELFGVDHVGCIHLNDSRHSRGSRRDRHANIGSGEIGLEAIGRFVLDERFREVPMILETPVGKDGGGHRRDLGRLRDLVDG